MSQKNKCDHSYTLDLTILVAWYSLALFFKCRSLITLPTGISADMWEYCVAACCWHFNRLYIAAAFPKHHPLVHCSCLSVPDMNMPPQTQTHIHTRTHTNSPQWMRQQRTGKQKGEIKWIFMWMSDRLCYCVGVAIEEQFSWRAKLICSSFKHNWHCVAAALEISACGTMSVKWKLPHDCGQNSVLSKSPF